MHCWNQISYESAPSKWRFDALFEVLSPSGIHENKRGALISAKHDSYHFCAIREIFIEEEKNSPL